MAEHQLFPRSRLTPLRGAKRGAAIERRGALTFEPAPLPRRLALFAAARDSREEFGR